MAASEKRRTSLHVWWEEEPSFSDRFGGLGLQGSFSSKALGEGIGQKLLADSQQNLRALNGGGFDQGLVFYHRGQNYCKKPLYKNNFQRQLIL